MAKGFHTNKSMGKPYSKKNLYWVYCINKSGFCYASHSNCEWEQVKELRKTAKLLGETIEHEKVGVREYY